MKKTSLTRALLVAGAMAVAGIGAAQADAIFYPDGTSVDLGPTGADNLALSSDSSMLAMDHSMSDTSVLGAGPAVTTTTTTVTSPVVQYEYVQPNIDFDPALARMQMRDHRHMVRHHAVSRTVVTTPVATSSGDAVIVGSYEVPYNTVSTGPVYVFSY